MSALGRETNALLAAARQGLAPDAAAIARMRTHIAAKLAAPAAAPAAAHVAAAGAAGKLVVLAALGVIAVATTAVVVVTRRPAPQPTHALRSVLVPVVAARPPPAPVAVPPEPAPTVVAPTLPPPPPPSPPRHARVIAAPAPAPAPPVVAPPLAREVDLLDHAGDALRAAHYADALDSIATYTRETAGHGQLAEEAAAIGIEATCRSGASAADARADFDARWPHSAARARLAAACGATQP
jgi:hypothetical protein